MILTDKGVDIFSRVSKIIRAVALVVALPVVLDGFTFIFWRIGKLVCNKHKIVIVNVLNYQRRVQAPLAILDPYKIECYQKLHNNVPRSLAS